MAKCWLFQRASSGKSWLVGWYDPDGKRREKQFKKKTDANKFLAAKSGELVNAVCGIADRKWAEFRKEYEATKLTEKRPATQVAYRTALDHFERIVRPKKVSAITTRNIDEYTAKRAKERGRKTEGTVSPATINKELRALRRVLNVACNWNYLAKAPIFEFLSEPETQPTFVSMEEFELLYQHCHVATKPNLSNISNEDWWRAYLLFCYMTGWRMNEVLHLLRADVDLDAGTAITRSRDNKGKRDEVAYLHPLLIEHLRKLQGFSVELFQWQWYERALYDQWWSIQDAASVQKKCNKNHVHNEHCRYFGFHDLRRGFATQNATNLSPVDLKKLMRHVSFKTTERYINMAAQAPVVEKLAVPNLKKNDAS